MTDSFTNRLKALNGDIQAAKFFEAQDKVNHKDFYLRFATEVFAKYDNIPIETLYIELERQYVKNDFIQSPVLADKKYNIIVAPKVE